MCSGQVVCRVQMVRSRASRCLISRARQVSARCAYLVRIKITGEFEGETAGTAEGAVEVQVAADVEAAGTAAVAGDGEEAAVVTADAEVEVAVEWAGRRHR